LALTAGNRLKQVTGAIRRRLLTGTSRIASWHVSN